MRADIVSTLVEWRDARGDAPGEGCMDMRARLAAYFSRKGCLFADELADETLARLARRVIGGENATSVSPAQDCYITARYVFLDYLRSPDRAAGSLSRGAPQPGAADDSREDRERVLGDLEACLATLREPDRALLLEYYSGSAGARGATRGALAARRGLSAEALTLAACRLRERVRRMLDGRLEQK